jgi:hypothetical protein
VRLSAFPDPRLYPFIRSTGYAGGIGPDCIRQILETVLALNYLEKVEKNEEKNEEKNNENEGKVEKIRKIEGKEFEGEGKGARDETFKGVWIDMESSLRDRVVVKKDGGEEVVEDVFSLEKCFRCIIQGLAVGLPSLY